MIGEHEGLDLVAGGETVAQFHAAPAPIEVDVALPEPDRRFRPGRVDLQPVIGAAIRLNNRVVAQTHTIGIIAKAVTAKHVIIARAAVEDIIPGAAVQAVIPIEPEIAAPFLGQRAGDAQTVIPTRAQNGGVDLRDVERDVVEEMELLDPAGGVERALHCQRAEPPVEMQRLSRDILPDGRVREIGSDIDVVVIVFFTPAIVDGVMAQTHAVDIAFPRAGEVVVAFATIHVIGPAATLYVVVATKALEHLVHGAAPISGRV